MRERSEQTTMLALGPTLGRLGTPAREEEKSLCAFLLLLHCFLSSSAACKIAASCWPPEKVRIARLCANNKQPRPQEAPARAAVWRAFYRWRRRNSPAPLTSRRRASFHYVRGAGPRTWRSMALEATAGRPVTLVGGQIETFHLDFGPTLWRAPRWRHQRAAQRIKPHF